MLQKNFRGCLWMSELVWWRFRSLDNLNVDGQPLMPHRYCFCIVEEGGEGLLLRSCQ
jgi:hypothetical protein